MVGLISGVPTSAAPRLVLQISDLHLRRYPIHNAHLQVVILDNDRSLSRITTWAFLKECKMASTAALQVQVHEAGGHQRRQAGTAFADLLCAIRECCVPPKKKKHNTPLCKDLFVKREEGWPGYDSIVQEAPCLEKPLEKSGLERAASNSAARVEAET